MLLMLSNHLWGGAACTLTISRMSSGVLSPSPCLACTHTPGTSDTWLVGAFKAISIDTASAQGKQKGRRLDDHEGGYLQDEAWSVYDGQIGAIGVLSPQDNWLSGYCACTAITMGDFLGSTCAECSTYIGRACGWYMHGFAVTGNVCNLYCIGEGSAPPVRARCASVIALMAAATAVSGTMGGPYSSESSACSRQRGVSALGSWTIITMRGLQSTQAHVAPTTTGHVLMHDGQRFQ